MIIPRANDQREANEVASGSLISFRVEKAGNLVRCTRRDRSPLVNWRNAPLIKQINPISASSFVILITIHDCFDAEKSADRTRARSD